MNVRERNTESMIDIKNNVYDNYENLLVMRNNLGTIKPRVNEMQNVANRLSSVVSLRVAPSQEPNREFLESIGVLSSKSIGELTSECIQQQKKNMELLVKEQEKLIRVIDGVKNDNAYLQMDSTKLDEHIKELMEIEAKDLMPKNKVAIPFKNIDENNFEDAVIKAFVRKFNNEVKSMNAILERKYNELYELVGMIDKYQLSRI